MLLLRATAPIHAAIDYHSFLPHGPPPYVCYYPTVLQGVPSKNHRISISPSKKASKSGARWMLSSCPFLTSTRLTTIDKSIFSPPLFHSQNVAQSAIFPLFDLDFPAELLRAQEFRLQFVPSCRLSFNLLFGLLQNGFQQRQFEFTFPRNARATSLHSVTFSHLLQILLNLLVLLSSVLQCDLIFILQNCLHWKHLQLFQQSGYRGPESLLNSMCAVGPRTITFHWNTVDASIAPIRSLIPSVEGAILSPIFLPMHGAVHPGSTVAAV